MEDQKNQQLARDITEFCKERLMSQATKSKGSKSALQTVLAAFVAVSIAAGSNEPNKNKWTQV